MNGHKDFQFQLDGSGACTQSFSKTALGITVQYNCTIVCPDGSYDVKIAAPNGSVAHFGNIHPRQPMQGQIKTNFFGSTDVAITVAGGPPNALVSAALDYHS